MPKMSKSITTNSNDKRIVRAQERLNKQAAKQSKAITSGMKKAAGRVKGGGSYKGGPV